MADDQSVRNYSRVSTPRTPHRCHHRTYFDVRSRHSFPARDNSDDEDLAEEALLELVKRSWNLWAVSPLFGLNIADEVKLKLYAKRLRENVASTLTKEDVSYDAKFTPLENLVCHPADPPALKVEVNSKTDGQDGVNCIYMGIFLSWGQTRNTDSEYVALPILLHRGAQGVAQAVHSILCQMFDCLITAMPASQEDLMWLAALVLNSSLKPDTRRGRQGAVQTQLHLEYHVPGLAASNSINIKLPMATGIGLWSKIHPTHPSSVSPDKQADGVINLEQVEQFFESVKNLMLENAMLEIGYCLLSAVHLPRFTIKGNKIKVTDIDTLDRILWFFQEKASIYSPTLSPLPNTE